MMFGEYLHELLVFGGLLIFSQLSPGPDQTLVTRTSLLYGFKAGTAVTLGISFGIIGQAIIVVTLGSALLQSAWGSLFFYAAGCWLIYLAWKIWPKKGMMGQSVEAISAQSPPKLGELFKDAMVCNLLNPKCTLFLVALSAPLIQYNTGLAYSCFFVAFTFVAGGLSWIIWVVVFQWMPVRKLYARYMVAIDRVFAVVLVIFALCMMIFQNHRDGGQSPDAPPTACADISTHRGEPARDLSPGR